MVVRIADAEGQQPPQQQHIGAADFARNAKSFEHDAFAIVTTCRNTTLEALRAFDTEKAAAEIAGCAQASLAMWR